jgi:hypothetical protein
MSKRHSNTTGQRTLFDDSAVSRSEGYTGQNVRAKAKPRSLSKKQRTLRQRNIAIACIRKLAQEQRFIGWLDVLEAVREVIGREAIDDAALEAAIDTQTHVGVVTKEDGYASLRSVQLDNAIERDEQL